jgi:succinyl-CoA synthetase beta subunit
MIAGRNVQVIMPDILTAGWLVVLAGGNTIAIVNLLHGDGDDLRRFLDIGGQMRRKIVDVFVMLVGNDENVARIARPLLGTDNGLYYITLANNICINGLDVSIFNTLYQQAKWASIIVGSMIVHD